MAYTYDSNLRRGGFRAVAAAAVFSQAKTARADYFKHAVVETRCAGPAGQRSVPKAPA